jgi:uncharacterized phage protein (TIGR01671 family)
MKMREIKFRGKRIDNGEWVCGGIIHQTDCYGDLVDRWFIVDGTTTLDYGIGYNEEVFPETVGQSTGRKDANGNTIYEFDTVKDIQPGKIKTVAWALNGFVLKSAEGFYEYTYFADEYEVIGNIHEEVTE